MVLEEGGGVRQAEANVQGIAMTTLWAATARHCHNENQWRVKYVPHTYHAKRDGQGRGKISENVPAARNKRVMTSKAEL